ncbi:MAG: hypothetical protein ACYC2X_01715 [Coriobacteriia bacterium]
MSVRNRWIAGGVALLLVLAGIGASLLSDAGGPGDGAGQQDAAVDAPVDRLDAVSADSDESADDSAADSGNDAADDSDTQLVVTTPAAARNRATSVKDTPTPPRPSTPTEPTTDPGTGTPVDPGSEAPTDPDDDGLTEEERQYLEETREIVETNEESLRDVSDELLQAIVDRDEGVLTTRLAADEGPQPDYVAYLAARYPEITAVKPGTTVNIFSADSATMYFTYAQVVWLDAGITSQHTISIPLRYSDGAWHLTSLDESTEGLTFVQAVRL